MTRWKMRNKGGTPKYARPAIIRKSPISGAHNHGVLLNACMDYLALMKIPAWRINQKPHMRTNPDGSKRFTTPGADPGAPDILAVFPPKGLAVGLEIKTGTGRLSDVQRRSMDLWVEAGGVYVVIRSISELVTLVLQHRTEGSTSPPRSS